MTDVMTLPLRIWVVMEAHRYIRAMVAAVVGGAAALAFPDIDLLPMLFIALPVLLWLIMRSDSESQAFWIGWWFGFPHFVAGLYWIGNALLANGGEFAWAIPLAVGALPALLAIFIGLAALLTRWMVRHGWRALPSFAMAWTIMEWLRGTIFTGFPWNLMGSVWTTFDATAQPAWLIGTYGLSFLTVLVAAAPYAMMSRGWRHWKSWGPVAAGVLVIAAMAGFGAWRLAAHPTQFDKTVRLRVVQANIGQDDKWNNVDESFLTYLRLSSQADSGVTVFIWPETALGYFIADEPSRQALIGRFLPPGAVLITGAPRIARNRDGAITGLWNSLFVLDSDGHVAASYDKMHLVPFGEYLPLRPLLQRLGFDKLVNGLIDFSPGKERDNIAVGSLPVFTPLICYEAIFPGGVDGKGPPARWMVNITNDAWYGNTTGPRQHLMAAKMRAVEEGLPLARAAGTGISAIFDPLGRRINYLNFDRQGTVDSFLPLPATPGPYAKFGNAILLFMLIVCAIVSRKTLFITRRGGL